eukprot:UC4_evm1s827
MKRTASQPPKKRPSISTITLSFPDSNGQAEGNFRSKSATTDGAPKTRARPGKSKPMNKSSNCQRNKAVDISRLPSTAKRSVSLAFLVRFTEKYDCWTMATSEVVKKIVAPTTKDKGCCWSELPPDQSLLRKKDLGPPQIFVSHAWQTPNGWGLLVSALQKFCLQNNADPEKLTCWVDVFVLNQHNYMNELKQLDKVIEICANFLQVINIKSAGPIHAAVPLSRIWCLYEVLQRIRSRRSTRGSGLTVAIGELKDEIIEDANGTEKKYFFKEATKNQIDHIIKMVDFSKAQAQFAKDRELVLKQCARISGGLSKINTEVQEALVHAAVRSIFNTEADAMKKICVPSCSKGQDILEMKKGKPGFRKGLIASYQEMENL